MAKKKATKGTPPGTEDELDVLQDALISYVSHIKDLGPKLFASVAQLAATRGDEIRRREELTRAIDTLARVLDALVEPEKGTGGSEGHGDGPDESPEGVLRLDEFRARRQRPEHS